MWMFRHTSRMIYRVYITFAVANRCTHTITPNYISHKPKLAITDAQKNDLLTTILPYGLDTYAITGRPTFIKIRHGCIMFIDIVSYCKIVGENTDVIVFLILKKIYDMFDTVIDKYKYIQKIETIGDAYMVVGNMETPGAYNPETYMNMIRFGEEILQKIKHINIPDRNIQLRIGIHSGSFVTSFPGKIRPRLCVIGKHINIASRIQSTAQPNTIQISNDMYNIIRGFDSVNDSRYTFIQNQNVILKNIGAVNTYTITTPE